MITALRHIEIDAVDIGIDLNRKVSICESMGNKLRIHAIDSVAKTHGIALIDKDEFFQMIADKCAEKEQTEKRKDKDDA